MNFDRKFPLLLLLVYLLSGPVVEIAHVDGLSGGSGSASLVQPPDGTTARHVSLDGRHECLACMISIHRQAVPVVPPRLSYLYTPHSLVSDAVASSFPHRPSFLLPTKRGPPGREVM
ncbi:MAG: hypothetical protein WB699_05765 [Bacteroidota bacterium]